MRGNYEKPPWEFHDRPGLFALDCRTDGHWDDRAGRYGTLSAVPAFAIRGACCQLNNWLTTTIQPQDMEPHYHYPALSMRQTTQ